MVSTRQKGSRIFAGLVLAGMVFAWFAPSVVATGGQNSDIKLSDEQIGAISQNCSTIKQSLEQLQYADSRTRTYLGSIYETLANKFITPLNLRLVKNNLSTLPVQAEFMATQTKFKDAYTDYMKVLGETIATDCKNEPENFYQKLEMARTRRATLKEWTDKLDELTGEQYQDVQKLIKEVRSE